MENVTQLVRASEFLTRRSPQALVALLAVTVTLAVLPVNARADSTGYSLSAESEFGPQLSDISRTRIVVSSLDPGAVHFSCDSTVSQVGNQIVITVIAFPGSAPLADPCASLVKTPVGPLAAGVYEVAVSVTSQSGATLDYLTTSVTIVARGPKCNANPFVNLILVNPFTSFSEFLTRMQTDPAYQALLGDVAFVPTPGFSSLFLAFPPLQDPVRELAHLQQTDQFKSVVLNENACLSLSPFFESIRTVVEYHNTLLDHYFMTPDAGEQAAIEAGQVGAGWVRTGNDFTAVVTPGCPIGIEGGFHPVYRFAGIPNIGPNSHFFTVSQDECAVVRDRTEWHWQFEGAPFWATEPTHGICPPGTKSLYRAYNNGIGGTANHRYSTDVAIIEAMVAKGWVSEGVTMCVLP